MSIRNISAKLAGIGALAFVAGGSALAIADPQPTASPTFRVKPTSRTSAPQGYSPAQMLHAYGFDDPAVSGQDGTGQVIAIVDAYGSPTIQNDVAYFCNYYKIPACNLIVATPQGIPNRNAGWAFETTLDVEWAHAIAPGATILLVETANESWANLLGGVDYAVSQNAKVVSMSWGANDFSGETAWDFHFNVPGVTFFASSGDTGGVAIWPSVSPNVVSVGGTTLTIDKTTGNVVSETGWSGSGGGTSQYEAMPPFQSSLGLSGRGTPDVAYNADPNTGVSIYDTTRYSGQSGWFVVGGTSAGAPQWAALLARVNGARASSLTQTLGDLYGVGTSCFTDIVKGSTKFPSGPGWDLVTGLGSPLDATLAPALVSGQ
jgi:subtilase family serine protease